MFENSGNGCGHAYILMTGKQKPLRGHSQAAIMPKQAHGGHSWLIPFDYWQQEDYVARMNKENLPVIHPCIKCGKAPKVEVSRPEGRINDIYRLVCECGNCPLQWSVSESAAIRLWNSYVAS